MAIKYEILLHFKILTLWSLDKYQESWCGTSLGKIDLLQLYVLY